MSKSKMMRVGDDFEKLVSNMTEITNELLQQNGSKKKITKTKLTDNISHFMAEINLKPICAEKHKKGINITYYAQIKNEQGKL